MSTLNCFQLIQLSTLVLLFATVSVYGQCGPKDGYYPYGDQCDAYIRCVGGQAIEQQLCPDGLVFNEIGNVSKIRCELPHAVSCEGRPYLQPAQPFGDCPRQNAMVGQCTSFIMCTEGRSAVINCPSGLAFNEQAGVCDWGDRVPQCEMEKILGFSCPVPGDQEQFAKFGDHARYPASEPNKYFVCVRENSLGQPNPSPRLLTCPDEGRFNPETFSCEAEDLNRRSPYGRYTGSWSSSSRFGSNQPYRSSYGSSSFTGNSRSYSTAPRYSSDSRANAPRPPILRVIRQ